MAKKYYICSVCHKVHEGYGNNAEPINRGKCCDECNKLVVATRLNNLRKGGNQ